MPLHIARSQPENVPNINPNANSSVRWHGSFFVHHSLAHVNRALTLALLNEPTFTESYGLALDPYEAATFNPHDTTTNDPRYATLAALHNLPVEDTRLTVRHRWPPVFDAPDTGKLVLIQPWEFGSLPKLWVEEIENSVDEVWVPSNFVRECYIESGVPGEKVVVVPNGVNAERFHPGAANGSNIINLWKRGPGGTNWITRDTYKFLFVGGTITRKGIDILLDAFDRAFSAKDDVVLFVKDFGAKSFYANQGMSDLVRALQVKPGGAKIVYYTDDLSETDLAALYASADCLVHPYRGEGYGMPIAEAMASGKPAIVTGYGAALDFANETNAYLIPARVQSLGERVVSGMETVGTPYWAEPSRDALIEILQNVVANREAAAKIGVKAAQDMREKHTWHHAAKIAAERIFAVESAVERVAYNTKAFTLPLGLSNLSLGSATGLGWNAAKSDLTDSSARKAVGELFEERKQAALAETRAGKFAHALTLLDSLHAERDNDWDIINAMAVSAFQTGDTDRAIELFRKGVAVAPNPRDFHHNLAFILNGAGKHEEALENALIALDYSMENTDIRDAVERARQGLVGQAAVIQWQSTNSPRGIAGSPNLATGSPGDSKGTPDATGGPYDGRVGLAQSKKTQNTDLERILHQIALADDALNRCAEYDAEVARIQAESQAKDAKPRLSLCMIVKNEERFLRNCLESTRDVVDEIIIVDTGSTDTTIAIAREYGAKIIQHPWNDDFSEARNVSLKHATGNWALWLDADEEIAPGSGIHFRRAMENAPPKLGGFLVMFNNWLTSATRRPGSEVAVHHALRLFRLQPGVQFEGRIHEQNLRSLQELGYEYGKVEGLTIDHFGYAGEIMSLRNKHERFISMLKREVEENPIDEFRNFQLFNLGNAYFTAGDWDNAYNCLHEAAEHADKNEEYTVTLFIELIAACHRLSRPEEGLLAYDQSVELGVRHAGIDFGRGYCLLYLKRYKEAEATFREAIRLGAEDKSVYAKSGDAGVGTYKSSYGLALALVGQERHEEGIAPCLAVLKEQPTMLEARYLLTIIYSHLKRIDDAVRELLICLDQNPTHTDAIRDLGKLHLSRNDYAAALPYLRRTTQISHTDTEALAGLALACEQLELLDEAREAYERLRLLKPNSAEVCVNLGRILTEIGEEAEAIDLYADAIQINPDYGNAYFNAGDLLYKMGYFDRAAETYLAGLEVDPANAMGFFTLGNCLVQTEAYEAAVVSYQQALAQNPGLDLAKNNLEIAQGLLATSGVAKAA